MVSRRRQRLQRRCTVPGLASGASFASGPAASHRSSEAGPGRPEAVGCWLTRHGDIQWNERCNRWSFTAAESALHNLQLCGATVMALSECAMAQRYISVTRLLVQTSTQSPSSPG
ncbi:hypothetical protein F751_1626 [Auxenochlorella protothecoides]|uniref:Uncharacterized protein n=1 Tax=Auxenochlorella protothecoides TaxID=3075 RepID=A0A087SU46_AUXPR|nr:hypothetical protein F751_1626 [Auxenochlorella protothecoides]KFM29250.1 hypothetical protein F751_1626 [Auxenochlorella protothecoides]